MRIRSIQAEVKSVETDDPNGAFEVVLSDSSTDRDDEVVDAKAFDPLPDHITFDVDHGLSVSTTVGSGVPSYEGDRLVVRGTYSSIPRAQEVRSLVNEGHIRTTSVAYMGAKTETKDGLRHITKAELLNGSFVPIPSNRNALVLSSKAMKAGARNSTVDAGYITDIHDAAVALGATCDGVKSVRRPALKAVVGSYEDRQEDLVGALVDANAVAIAAAFPDTDPGEYRWYLSIVATFDDHVVYRIGWDDDTALSVTYTHDGDGVTITGTPEAVEVDQVVTPTADGDADKPVPTPQVPDASGAGTADAKGAGDDDDLQLRAHALSLLTAACTT